MRYAAKTLATCGALALLVTPAWAHPVAEPHLHGDALPLPLALAVVLGTALVLRRFRSRARDS